jgi:2-polyprenyl-6-methoxyphenol hydroxylase-like FAD-dependent oxidoreductase
MGRKALVIGGSVGGLFAAHLLRSAGWQVSVFERATGDLGDRGTGIGTREELFSVMRRIGLAADTSIGVEVHGRIGLQRDGRVAHELPIHAITSAWSRIWRPLRRALPDHCYLGGKSLARIEQDGTCATALFADGSKASGDLLVAADGLHSTARAALLPDVRPTYAGYVAWRGVVDEQRIPTEHRDLLLRHMTFGFPDGELMLSIPMPGPEHAGHPGVRRCHFVWFRPVAESALPDLFTDAGAFGRVALLGDAAFVARPHVASGVMKAAIDAETLADALASDNDIGAALLRYDAERQPYGAWLVERGRHIGGHFVNCAGDPKRRIETLMREYGSAGIVQGQPIASRAPAQAGRGTNGRGWSL